MPQRVLAAFFLTALVTWAQTGRSPNFYSIEKERSLGSSQALEMQRKTTLLGNAVASDYLQKMGARLAAQIPQSDFPYTFAIVKDDVGGPLHEPVVLAGGYIFVPAALFLTAQNDAEFAAMLAHAMQHVVTRDATRAATRSELLQLATIPAVFDAGATQKLMQPAGARIYESAADLTAVDTLSAAGFDPHGLSSYIGRVQPGGDTALSNLPARDSRLTAIADRIQRLPSQSYAEADVLAIVQDQVRGSLQ